MTPTHDTNSATPDSAPQTMPVTGDNNLETPDNALSLSDAAQHLGVSERTVLRRIEKGLIHAYKVDTPHGLAWRISLDSTPVTPDTASPAHTVTGDTVRAAEAGTRDKAPQTTPEVLELVRLVDRLQQEASEKAEKIAELTGAAAHWQTRAIVAEEQARRQEEQIKLLMAPRDEPEPVEPEPPAEPVRVSWWRRLFS